MQIGSADSMSDLPQASEQYEVSVQAGDVVVLGTDGLWDNCFDEEVRRVQCSAGEGRGGGNCMTVTHARHSAIA